MTSVKLIFAFLLALCAAPAALAQWPCSTPSPDCVVVGEWDITLSIGAGERSNPVSGGSDIPLIVLPQISYYGERFFIENLDLGVTLYESRAHTLNLLASPGYDRVFFVRDDLQNYFIPGAGGGLASAPPTVSNPPLATPPDSDEPPPDSDAPAQPTAEAIPLQSRRTTWFTGLEWMFYVGRVTGQVDVLYEATGRHKGYEVRTAAAAPLVQGANSLVISGGVTWKSAETVDYYYGVNDFYRPDDAFNPFVRLGYSRALSERWTFTAFAHYEQLDDAIADSPIISDSGVATVFAGLVWQAL